MNNQLITYYIPTNPNVTDGTIYTLYLNNNTNLDLTSILQKQDKTSISFKENKLIKEGATYDELIEIIDKTSTLLTDINNYQQVIFKSLQELINLNQKCQLIVKGLEEGRKI